MDIANSVLTRQLIKSATSVGANYSEACEAISIKDRISKIAISRKEAKESIYWIDLLNSINNNVIGKELTEESTAILKVMASIHNILIKQSKTNS
jgi:four helix bundle protein